MWQLGSQRTQSCFSRCGWDQTSHPHPGTSSVAAIGGWVPISPKAVRQFLSYALPSMLGCSHENSCCGGRKGADLKPGTPAYVASSSPPEHLTVAGLQIRYSCGPLTKTQLERFTFQTKPQALVYKPHGVHQMRQAKASNPRWV